MTEHDLIVAASAVTGTLFGVIAGRELIPRILRRAGWRKPPRLPEFKLPPLTVACPRCGQEIGVEISGGYDAPDLEAAGFEPVMPLGQRLEKEKTELLRRLAGVASNTEEAARYRRRIATITEQLKRMH